MKSRPKFSVIIPVQRIYDYLREHMKSYEKQLLDDFEIIILSDIKEKDKFPQTRIIKTGKVPPSTKRNIGAKKAKGEILAFIDDDAYPLKDWLKVASREFENKKIVALGGPSLSPPQSTFFQRISNKVYELSSSKTGIRYGKGKRQNIDDWPTCNLLVRRADFLKVGGSEELWGGEDTQLCYALLKTKKEIIYNPDLAIYHHPRTKLKSHLKQSYFWGMWRGFFMKKHPKQSRQLTFFIPPLFVLGLILGAILSILSPLIKSIYFSTLGIYAIYLICIGIKAKNLKFFFPIIGVMFLTQVAYGIGFFKGIFAGKEGPTKKGMHSFEKLKCQKK